jgi:hypothetical protein
MGLLLSGRDGGLPISYGTSFLVGCRQVVLTTGHNIRQASTPANTTFSPADDPRNCLPAQTIQLAPGYAEQSNTDMALVKLAQRLPEAYGNAAYVLQRPPGRTSFGLVMGFGYDDFPDDGGTCGILRMGWVFNRNATHGETAMGRDHPAGQRAMIHTDLIIPNTLRERPNRLFKLWRMDSGAPLVDCGSENSALNCNRVFGVYSAGTYSRETRFNQDGSEALMHYALFASIWDNRDWLRQTINEMCGENVIPAPEDWPAPVAPAGGTTLLGGGGDPYEMPSGDDVDHPNDDDNHLSLVPDEGGSCATCTCAACEDG